MIRLTRFVKNTNCIIGSLTFNESSFFSLERPETGLEPNKNLALPIGTYNLELTVSKRFGECILIYSDDVPKSRRILIHAGNKVEDTKGCVLIGCSCNLNGNSISESRNAVNRLLQLVKSSKDQPLQLVIEEV